MKKIFVVFCLIFTFPFYACANSLDNVKDDFNQLEFETTTDVEDDILDDGVGDAVEDGIESTPTQKPEAEEDEQEKKKKTYLVSNVNSLRVRSAASTNSKVLGSLDKNDALIYVDKVGDYYKTIFMETEAYVYSKYCATFEVEIGSTTVEKAIEIGATLAGYPYVWGSQRYHWGNGVLNKNFVEGEFDCSALVQYAYYKADKILLDVTSRKQSNNGVEVAKGDLKRGDLMFFTNASRKDKTGEERIGHVGIYFGNNYILHTASDHAVIEPISAARWGYYVTARRVV